MRAQEAELMAAWMGPALLLQDVDSFDPAKKVAIADLGGSSPNA